MVPRPSRSSADDFRRHDVAGRAPGDTLDNARQPRFPPAVAGRLRHIGGALAGNAGGRGVRLSAHRFGVRCRADDAAAHAAAGAVRGGDRRPGRADRAAQGADRGRAADADDLAVARRARPCRNPGGLASGARQLLQRGRVGDRQPGAAGHDRRGRRVRGDGLGDVARCRRQQRQPHAGPDDRRRAARLVPGFPARSRSACCSMRSRWPPRSGSVIATSRPARRSAACWRASSRGSCWCGASPG